MKQKSIFFSKRLDSRFFKCLFFNQKTSKTKNIIHFRDQYVWKCPKMPKSKNRFCHSFRSLWTASYNLDYKASMPTRLSRLAKLRRSTKRNMLWYLIYFFTSFTKKVYEITLRKYIHPQQCTVVQFWSLPFRKSTMKIGNLQNCPLYPFLHAGNYLEIWFLYCLTNPN